ncbi:GIY-YIG nuclease family protein [Arenicella xantha]|uniref:T5orf172 domain-containing protein n=1 Tax=Arenicella xantha TaxID=644221 RepID=A0A395JTS0_9GAMM|nr:GIY-YIG nuclease family protein [Arenicella xantha]RBP52988.1 T5orf172 domain-containing protein [Arenicella xantha]
MKSTSNKGGYIYIMSNPDIPNLVKIGYTTRVAHQRTDENSSWAGVPSQYKVDHAFKSDNPRQDKKKAHRALNSVHHDKEFFKCSVKHAFEVLDRELGAAAKAIEDKEKFTRRARAEARDRLRLVEEEGRRQKWVTDKLKQEQLHRGFCQTCGVFGSIGLIAFGVYSSSPLLFCLGFVLAVLTKVRLDGLRPKPIPDRSDLDHLRNVSPKNSFPRRAMVLGTASIVGIVIWNINLDQNQLREGKKVESSITKKAQIEAENLEFNNELYRVYENIESRQKTAELSAPITKRAQIEAENLEFNNELYRVYENIESRQKTAELSAPQESYAEYKCITIGMKMKQIQSIQGNPSTVHNHTNEIVWRYGVSTVVFVEGVVTEWSDKGNNLKLTR